MIEQVHRNLQDHVDNALPACRSQARKHLRNLSSGAKQGLFIQLVDLLGTIQLANK